MESSRKMSRTIWSEATIVSTSDETPSNKTQQNTRQTPAGWGKYCRKPSPKGNYLGRTDECAGRTRNWSHTRYVLVRAQPNIKKIIQSRCHAHSWSQLEYQKVEYNMKIPRQYEMLARARTGLERYVAQANSWSHKYYAQVAHALCQVARHKKEKWSMSHNKMLARRMQRSKSFERIVRTRK